jgi:hypothetical protein
MFILTVSLTWDNQGAVFRHKTISQLQQAVTEKYRERARNARAHWWNRAAQCGARAEQSKKKEEKGCVISDRHILL